MSEVKAEKLSSLWRRYLSITMFLEKNERLELLCRIKCFTYLLHIIKCFSPKLIEFLFGYCVIYRFIFLSNYSEQTV